MPTRTKLRCHWPRSSFSTPSPSSYSPSSGIGSAWGRPSSEPGPRSPSTTPVRLVGAGAAYGEEALKVATTVKLTRALWIIPLSLVSALIFRQKGKKIQIPWFIFWFVVAMLVNTYCNLPTQLTHGISVAARCGLSATLFLIGGGLSIEVIRKVGLKPLVLGIILWAVISVASLAVILLL